MLVLDWDQKTTFYYHVDFANVQTQQAPNIPWGVGRIKRKHKKRLMQ